MTKYVEDALTGCEHITGVLCRSDPLDFDPSNPVVRAVAESVGSEPTSDIFVTEAEKLVPVQRVCVCGPGDPRSSCSENEFVTLRDLERTYEMILALVDRSPNLPSPMEGPAQ